MTKKQQQSSSKITKMCRMCLSDNSRKEFLCINDSSNNELRIKFETCFRVKIFKKPLNLTYLCIECSDSLDPFLELQKKVRRNEKVYFNGVRKRYKCDLCSYQSFRKTRIKTHIEQKHLNINFSSCKFCSLKFCRKSNLRDHVQNKHNGNHKYLCKQCTRKFKLEIMLKHHMKTCHPKMALNKT